MPDSRTIEERLDSLLEQLENPDLSAYEIERLEERIRILERRK